MNPLLGWTPLDVVTEAVDDVLPDDRQRQGDLATAVYIAACVMLSWPVGYMVGIMVGNDDPSQSALELWIDAAGLAGVLYMAFPLRRQIGRLFGFDPGPVQIVPVFGDRRDR